jgi:putative membrane protein
MRILAIIAAVIVAIEHLGFLVLEMFLWQEEAGMSVFGLTPEEAAQTATLAANQGLYNGFLAAGLVWAVLRGNREFTRFFLLCVIAAGVFGALTASPTILYVQAAPAAVALVLSFLGKKA